MARIRLDELAHSYRPQAQPAEYALHPFTMDLDDGGAYALLGPSGCGKTTLLNIISGLVTPSRGRILFDDLDVSALSPQRRNIAQVFQFPVIYDTMTVFDNLAFPLRNRRVNKERIRARVGQIAEMLELSADLDRRASGLTADAKQKISLGRGLVRSDVAAVLFDEPLTVIDPHLKWQLRRKLKQIHHELRLTLLYVTHDQVEALTFADRIMVMSQGRVMQTGSAEELFERPAHTFVGHFIGSPGMNLLDCERGTEGNTLRVAGRALAIPADRPAPSDGLRGRPMQLGLRPEYTRLAAAGEAGAISVEVIRLQDVGTSLLLTARLGETLLRARLPAGSRVPANPWLSLINEHTCWYAGGALLS